MIYYQKQQPYKNGNGKLMTTAVFVSNQKQRITCYSVQHCLEENGESNENIIMNSINRGEGSVMSCDKIEQNICQK